MPSALESQAALRLITFNADQRTRAILAGLTGTPQQILAALLEIMPELIAYYSMGSAAIAADLFDDLRDGFDLHRLFRADPVIVDRTEKIRNAVVWATQPLTAETNATVSGRLAEVVQAEVARPYRDTITKNSSRDPESVGWSRVAGDSCGFCRMLAGRGAVYKRDTARFAAHGHCDCTARPEFRGGETGPEASAMQYLASKSSKTARQKQAVADYVSTFYPG